MKVGNALTTLDRLFGFINVCGHTFYAKQLGPTSIVLDLGASSGDFSQYITSQYKCEIFAVEASPQLFAQIDGTPAIHKYNYAIANSDGHVRFYESSSPMAGNIIGRKPNSTGNWLNVKSRSFDSLISEIGLLDIDLLKVDIEGAEIQMFDNMECKDFMGVKQMTVEFHDSVPIPNVSADDVGRVVKKIVSMGFYGSAMRRRNLDWLFVKKNKVNLPLLSKLYLSLRKQVAKVPSRPSKLLRHDARL